MDIQWKPSFPATCMHAADVLRQGRAPADDRWRELVEEVRELAEVGASLSHAPHFWRVATALAGEIDSNRELAGRILNKLGGGMDHQKTLDRAITALEGAVRRLMPDLERELPGRLRPLREQWEARGPGFLQHLRRRMSDLLVAPQATVYLVHPVAGGDGAAHIWFNSATIEGVLHNVTNVPETVRLGWLLAQLQWDLPVISEHLDANGLPAVARAAALPAAMEAAREVQWLGADVSTADVMRAWRLATAEDAERDAERIDRWWADTTALPWPRRLTELVRAAGGEGE